MERLAVLERTRDGFAVAEEDLRLRGAGDPGGVRQWGGGRFRVANPIRDFDILEKAREWAVRLAQDEIDLSAEEKARLEGWLASADTQGGAFSGVG
jgi:ATP-dependent DNA helicase RecG